jgi:hypothetical protein
LTPGSGSGIRVPDPGSGMRKKKSSEKIRIRDPVREKKPDPGWEEIRIRDEHPRSFSRELRKHFLGLKILNFFDADADPESGIFWTLDPGWKKFDSG